MTDLERARALIQYWKDCEQYVGQHMSLSTNFETLVPLISAARREARDEALEEAARVVEMHWGIGEATCVAEAIRALTDKP